MTHAACKTTSRKSARRFWGAALLSGLSQIAGLAAGVLAGSVFGVAVAAPVAVAVFVGLAGYGLTLIN